MSAHRPSCRNAHGAEIGLFPFPINVVNGPQPTVAYGLRCCDAARHSGPWCLVQDFHRSNNGRAGPCRHFPLIAITSWVASVLLLPLEPVDNVLPLKTFEGH